MLRNETVEEFLSHVVAVPFSNWDLGKGRERKLRAQLEKDDTIILHSWRFFQKVDLASIFFRYCCCCCLISTTSFSSSTMGQTETNKRGFGVHGRKQPLLHSARLLSHIDDDIRVHTGWFLNSLHYCQAETVATTAVVACICSFTFFWSGWHHRQLTLRQRLLLLMLRSWWYWRWPATHFVGLTEQLKRQHSELLVGSVHIRRVIGVALFVFFVFLYLFPLVCSVSFYSFKSSAPELLVSLLQPLKSHASLSFSVSSLFLIRSRDRWDSNRNWRASLLLSSVIAIFVCSFDLS